MWRIHVDAPRDVVQHRLEAYEDIVAERDPAPVGLADAGDWTTVVIAGRHHPWAPHNLTLWLLDTGQDDITVTVADGADGQVGYWLSDDPRDSWLSGYDERGAAITVRVPDNAWVVGDEIHHPPATPRQLLVDLGVPPALHDVPAPADEDDADHTVSLEDPGPDLNPALEPVFPTREAMARDRLWY